MTDVKFSSADINFVIHATENERIVFDSIKQFFGLSGERFISSPLDGHFGNKILSISLTVSAQEAQQIVSKIFSSLNSNDRAMLINSFDDYADEKGNLYLRLNKQKICQGKISLSDSDSIRFRFKPVRRYKPGSNIEGYRGLLASTE